jgi:hypothetical protein
MPPMPNQGQLPFPFPPPITPFSHQATTSQPSPEQENLIDKALSESSSFKLPFSTVPQPHELLENALKGRIWLLRLLLAVSEAARMTANSASSAKGSESEGGDDSQNTPTGAGMLTENEFLNNAMRSLFEASNTDYFYED